MLPDLNFPLFEFRFQKNGDKLMIFDYIRKKWVILTPEEWVRQHMVRYLIDYKGYPRSLIRVESGLKYDRLSKRSDLLVFDQSGSPFLVVECKAPDIALDTNVIRQASVYGKALKASHIGISNGLKHFCWAVHHESETTSLLSDFPAYP